MTTDRICVGAIAGAFGVQGEVRLKSFCAEPSAIADYGSLYSADGKTTYKITLTRPVAGGLGARMSGVKTKEEADALRGVQLFADRARLPSLSDDEYYHADLIGLEVYDTGGTVLGRVLSVNNHGAGDILEFSGPGTKGARMIPFTLAIVPTVDLASGRLIVDLPEGLLDDPTP